MNRTDDLWRDLGWNGAPPAADVRAVKARVHAALDADPTERKIYMRQKVRFILVAAAIAAAVTGSALALSANLDALQAYFQGDTAPAQAYLDNTARSVSDENYTLTVESSVADEHAAYLLVTVKALNDESRAFLFTKEFVGMDTFLIGALDANSAPADYGLCGFGLAELSGERTGDSITWRADVTLTGPADALRIRLSYMAGDKALEIPLNAAPSVSVALGVSGVGIAGFETQTTGTLRIERVILTPLTCQILTADEPVSLGFQTKPRLLFRMADGSIRTQSQMMEFTGGHTIGDLSEAKGPDDVTRASAEHDYRFREVQDLSMIQSVIAFDREFPLDGSAPKAVAHDPALDPFQMPTMGPLRDGGGYSIPVRTLTERLGGVCRWDAATGDVTCTFRGVAIVLNPGSKTAMVDGVGADLPEAPAVQDGVLAADYQLFFDAWGLDGFVLRQEDGEALAYGDWYIVP